MSKLRTAPKNAETIDWTKAAILERKKALGVTWKQVADEVGMSSEVLRKLIAQRPTVRWQEYTLKKVLRALNIPCGTFEIRIPEERRTLR